jgi:hypothetical protein
LKNDELAKMTRRLQGEAKALREKGKKMEEEAKLLLGKADKMDNFIREMEGV